MSPLVSSPLKVVKTEPRKELSMIYNTDDLRIKAIKELAPPGDLMREFPCTEKASATVYRARDEIHRIMHGGDDRLLVIVGPCSIHDFDAALEYAKRLQTLRLTLEPDLTIVMRVYFEKPRTIWMKATTLTKVCACLASCCWPSMKWGWPRRQNTSI